MIEKLKEIILKILARRFLIRQGAIVLLALAIVLFYIFGFKNKSSAAPPILPAYVALKCSSCGHTEDRRVSSLQREAPKCSDCGGALGYRLKCRDCEFEFPFFPDLHDTVECIKGKNRKEAFVVLLNQRICPNCGSPKTFHVMPELRDAPPQEAESKVEEKKADAADNPEPPQKPKPPRARRDDPYSP